MKKNVVLGILDKYSFHQVKKFFLSIQQTGYTGDICMFIGSNTTPRTIRLLQHHGVKTIFFKDLTSLPPGNLAAALFRLPQPINYFNFRHYLYYDFLQKHRDEYEYVFLTDVRDVYFQRDPFDFEMGDGLYCALEGRTKKLKECRFNGPWLEFIYGKQILDEMGDEIISCAGTTWGTTNAILDYLTKMLKEIEKLPDAYKAIDQAIHNYMIRKHMLPAVKFLNNDEGIILTLSYEQNYTIGTDNKVRTTNGRIVNVLHQFDRMPDLRRLTDRLFLTDSFWKYLEHKWHEANRIRKRAIQKIKFKIHG